MERIIAFKSISGKVHTDLEACIADDLKTMIATRFEEASERKKIVDGLVDLLTRPETRTSIKKALDFIEQYGIPDK